MLKGYVGKNFGLSRINLIRLFVFSLLIGGLFSCNIIKLGPDLVIDLDKASISSSETATLTATLTDPSDADLINTTTWKVDNSDYASLSRTEGSSVIVTGKEPGTANITATVTTTTGKVITASATVKVE